MPFNHRHVPHTQETARTLCSLIYFSDLSRSQIFSILAYEVFEYPRRFKANRADAFRQKVSELNGRIISQTLPRGHIPNGVH